MELPKIQSVRNLAGKRVLLRLDLNAPVQKGKITDDFRIRKSLPTIKYLRERGAKIIIVSHIESEENSLHPIYTYFSKKFPIHFVRDFYHLGQSAALRSMKDGDVVLLENIRRYEGEMDNDPQFGKDLAALADLYVNDAFSVSHRAQASIVGVPKHIKSYAGLIFQDEVKHLSKAFNPKKPFLFILCGAKFETKMPLVKKFLEKASFVFVGGALSNDIWKWKGYETGTSRVSNTKLDFRSIASNEKLLLPLDVVVETPSGSAVKFPEHIQKNERVVDAGPATLRKLRSIIDVSKFILWNGPLGCYEDGYTEGTSTLGELIAESRAESVIGGGDTLAVLAPHDDDKRFTFISTAGGAMLQYLADGTLPGIEALLDNSK